MRIQKSISLASAYTNLSNPQTIYVRVEDNTTGCYVTFEMELLVITPPPSIDYTFCSEDTPLEFNPPLYASASILVSDTSADYPSDTGIIGTGLGEYRLESVVLNVQGEMAEDLAFYLQPQELLHFGNLALLPEEPMVWILLSI